MDRLGAALAGTLGLEAGTVTRILWTLAVVVVLWVVRTVVLRVAWRHIDDIRSRYIWRKAVSYSATLLGVLIIGRIWLSGLGSVATFAGLVSAGIAIALKDVFVNFAGWFFILWRRPVMVGDRVEIAGHRGDVVDIRAFQFTLMEVGNWVDADQSTGRMLHVPNGLLMTSPLANYGQGFDYIWNELPVLVTFESNWKKAKTLLLRIAEERSEDPCERAEREVREASKKFMIFYSTLTPTVYTSVEESGVLLTIRYLCPPRRRRGTAHMIWEDVLESFAAESDIALAYPTTRFYRSHQQEPSEGGIE
ncbi:mechanosensitive ion channel family protein [bacterium]|nr:mechanosensitive ion channel family protein [bacterium]